MVTYKYKLSKVDQIFERSVSVHLFVYLKICSNLQFLFLKTTCKSSAFLKFIKCFILRLMNRFLSEFSTCSFGANL